MTIESNPRPRREAPPARLPDRAIWVNGRVVRGDEAAMSLFDRGARDGEGLFETIRVEGGAPVAWDRHLERMVLAAAELGFPVPPAPAVLRAALSEVLSANGLSDAAARITVTRGVAGGHPTRAGCWIDAEPLAARLWRGARSGSATVIYSSTPFVPGPFGRYKTTSRIAYDMAREEARTAGADEALLVSPDHEVLEGAVSNVFVVLGGEVLTPSLDRNILPGVTRARAMAAAAALGIRVREGALPRELAEVADEVFLTNAVQGVVPLSTLAGRPVPGRSIGERIREAVVTST